MNHRLLVAFGLVMFPMLNHARSLEHDELAIPRGRGVLLDGKVDRSEWADARDIVIAPAFRVLVKHDDNFLYVAVVRSTPAVFGVNLYIAPPPSELAPTYLDLHASAKLGERVGRAGAWPDWEWWNNRAWSANVARFNSFSGERFLPDTAKEYQIALDRLPGSRFLLTFDVETASGPQLPVAAGQVRDGIRWLAMQLAR